MQILLRKISKPPVEAPYFFTAFLIALCATDGCPVVMWTYAEGMPKRTAEDGTAAKAGSLSDLANRRSLEQVVKSGLHSCETLARKVTHVSAIGTPETD